MNYREATILAKTDIGATGDTPYDIDLSDVISEIDLIWDYTNVTNLVNTAHPVECIEEIEIRDGSDVIFSLSGRQAQAIAYEAQGLNPYNNISVRASSVSVAVIPIQFGRYLFDTEYALDPDRFKNLQIRVKHDEDKANGSAVVNHLEILARVFDEKKPSPSAFLMNRDFYEYSMAASSHKYINLPDDYILRGMYLEAYSTAHSPITLLDGVKLSENVDKKIPFDYDEDSLYRYIVGSTPLYTENIEMGNAITTGSFYTTMSEDLQYAVNYDATPITAGGEFSVPTFTGSLVTYTAAVAIKLLTAQMTGRLPHSMIPFPFGNQQVEDDWYDIRAIANLRLDLLASSDADSGDTTRVVLQQVRPY